MKHRIEKRLADFNEEWLFPQYYVEPYFFKLLGGFWKDYREWKGCDLMGSDYGDGSVYFKYKEDAINFIKQKKYKKSVICIVCNGDGNSRDEQGEPCYKCNGL